MLNVIIMKLCTQHIYSLLARSMVISMKIKLSRLSFFWTCVVEFCEVWDLTILNDSCLSCYHLARQNGLKFSGQDSASFMQGCSHAISHSDCVIYFFKITELQSFRCTMHYLLKKISVLCYLLSENRYLLWDFGTPLPYSKILWCLQNCDFDFSGGIWRRIWWRHGIRSIWLVTMTTIRRLATTLYSA